MARDEEGLRQLIDTGGPSATADGLRSIVKRREAARSRRRRTVGAGAGVLALALLGTSVALTTKTGPGTHSALSPSAAVPRTPAIAPNALIWREPLANKSAGPTSSASAVACPAGTTCTFSPLGKVLFSRTLDGVHVVATLLSPLPFAPNGAGTLPATTPSQGSTGVAPGFDCGTTAELHVEISAGARRANPLTLPAVASEGASIEGIATETVPANGHSATVVALRTGGSVKTVAARFGDGRLDEMTAVDGWAVLVDPDVAPAAAATPGKVAAFNAAGQQVATQVILRQNGVAVPDFCLGEPPFRTPIPAHSSK